MTTLTCQAPPATQGDVNWEPHIHSNRLGHNLRQAPPGSPGPQNFDMRQEGCARGCAGVAQGCARVLVRDWPKILIISQAPGGQKATRLLNRGRNLRNSLDFITGTYGAQLPGEKLKKLYNNYLIFWPHWARRL